MIQCFKRISSIHHLLVWEVAHGTNKMIAQISAHHWVRLQHMWCGKENILPINKAYLLTIWHPNPELFGRPLLAIQIGSLYPSFPLCIVRGISDNFSLVIVTISFKITTVLLLHMIPDHASTCLSVTSIVSTNLDDLLISSVGKVSTAVHYTNFVSIQQYIVVV